MVTPGAEAAERRKNLGAFYTPEAMASVLVDWAVRSRDDRVLDPSFGGLVFLSASARRLAALGQDVTSASAQLFGVDLDEDAHASAVAASELHLPDENILHRDFFDVRPVQHVPQCEAVVGNPPYIRYQGWDGTRARQVSADAGVKLTRLASSWAPFVVHATQFVAPGGRMAMVLPAEMFHAQYAAGVLEFLDRSFRMLTLATFEERVFPGALEEVVLLFAEGRGEGPARGARIVPCRTLEDLTRGIADDAPILDGPRASPGTLLAQLLPHRVRDLYAQLASTESVRRLGDFASVDIGAVTGANDFFLVDDTAAQELPRELLRVTVSKARHVQGCRLHDGDIQALRERGERMLMFVAKAGAAPEEHPGVARYLRRGKRAKLHERYKCRIRKPWWEVPVPRGGPPDLLLTYCSNAHPRLVLNEQRALHTNTVHAVNVQDKAASKAIAAGFVNSLTLLSAELEGRSYGGGVLKLEPTEAESLMMPNPAGPVPSLEAVDRALREESLDAVLNMVDPIVLGEGLGLDEQDQHALRDGALRLRERRKARGRRPATEGR